MEIADIYQQDVFSKLLMKDIDVFNRAYNIRN